jgi:hypothetical protein
MMNKNQSCPSAKELTELTAYLTARERGAQPAPNEPGFPSGLAGDLLKLAESTEPDPDFVARLELQLRRQLRQAPRPPARVGCLRCGNHSPNRKGKLS